MAMILRTKALLLLAIALFSWRLTAQNFLISQPNITGCDGFFLDSGGNDNPYRPNENYTTTICPNRSVGTHVQLVFSRVEVSPGDSLCFFDGNSTAAPRLACIGDFNYQGPFIIQATAANPSGCITVVFKSDATDQGGGWSADINCIQACQLIQSQLVSTTPAVSPADTGWIDVCPGDRVMFSARGLYPQNGVLYNHSDLNSRFEWEFGDGSTAVGPNVSHQYRQSGGYTVQLTITDTRGCRSINFINQRVRVAPKPTFAVGDNIPSEICSGDTIALNAIVNRLDRNFSLSAVSREGSFQSGAVRSDSLALPDGTGRAYETSVKFQNFSPGQVMTSATDIQGICVNMEHSWMRDLEIKLRCPSGKSIILHNFGGRSGSEVFLGEPIDFDGANPTPGKGGDYCWTRDGQYTWLEYANRFTTIRTLPEGNYKPFQPFDSLIGCPLNGEWTIEVLDLWAIDNGFIFSWGVNFNPALFPELEKFSTNIVNFSWKNNPTIFSATPTAINAAPVNAGQANYVFSITDNFGCVFDTSLNVSVLPPTHPNCRNCQELLRPVNDTVICENQSAAFNVAAGPSSQRSAITFEAFPQYSFGFSNHPPSRPYESVIKVNSVAPNSLTNAAQQIVSVCINIETDFINDIRVFLVSPSGRTLELTTNNGGSGTAYANTCFSPTATTPITSGTAPFIGTFRPEGNWNVLNGSPINGDWKLQVSDALGATEMGILKSWSITFNSTNTVQYTWTPAAGLSCANCPNPMARPNQTTIYTVRATDSYNCSARDTITVAVVRDAPAPNVTCGINRDSTALVFDWNSVLGATTYEVNVTKNGVASGWRGPINGLSFRVDSLMNNDTVRVDVRFFTGGQPINCNIETGSATCAFLICELKVDSIVTKPVDCFDNNTGSASIFVSGGVGNYSYLWSDTLRQIERTAILLKAGNYRVTVRDRNNCIAVRNIEIPQPQPINITPAVTDALCVGDANGRINTTITGGTGSYRFSWSNGQTAKDASNLRAGSYTLTVTDANNCQAQATAIVREPDAPVSMTITQTFRGCNGARGNQATVTPTGGTGSSYTFRWSNGQTGSVVGNLDSISYTVTVTDANGCTAVQSIKMQDLAPIAVNIIQSQPSCNGDTDGALGVNIVTGGAGRTESDYTFRWSNGQTGNAIRNLAGGISYTVTVTDIQGCTGITSRLLEEPPKVSFDIQITEPRCFGGDNGSATVTNLKGQGAAFSFRWDQNAKNQTSQTATNLIAGNYTVTVTDAKGCRNTGVAVVRQPARIETAFEIVNNKCFGEGKGAIAVSVKGGTPDYTYAWSNTRNTARIGDLAAGVYGLTVTDANNCTHTASATVTQPDALTATFNITNVTCFGDRNGSIKISPVGGTSPYQYSLDARSFSATSTFIALRAGEYRIQVRDANGCTFSDRVNVNEPAKFIVDAGDKSYKIRLGQSIELKATSTNGQGKVTFVWSAPYGNTLSCTECEQTTATPQDMIVYELYGIDEQGCEATDRVTVVVEKIREVAVPTGFTPNGDGNNDLLKVHGLDGTKVKMFRIYDRWGELIYEGGEFMVNDDAGWDGTFRGKPVNSGVYIWYLEVEYIDGLVQSLQGQTTLIR